MDDSVRNMIIASIVLVLAAMYGGDTLGSWFQWKKEIDWKDGDTEEYTSEFYLEEIKMEYEFDAGGLTEYEDTDDNLKRDYDDNDCGDSGDCDCRDVLGGLETKCLVRGLVVVVVVVMVMMVTVMMTVVVVVALMMTVVVTSALMICIMPRSSPDQVPKACEYVPKTRPLKTLGNLAILSISRI